ncbi:MAG: HAD family phosphatase [Saprospiraceae bacterium]|nr:HAD family phosphatase [Saprospiraceae bacterium]
MNQGFIFDMDGTMVDNMMTHHRAWQIKLRELGLEMSLHEVHQTIHGKNEEIIERLFGDRFTTEERRAISADKEARYREVFKEKLALIEGLSDFLNQCLAQNIPLSIGTAAPPENVQFAMDNLDLHRFFKKVINASDVTKGKPNPEVFEKAAAGMGIPLSHCLVFEDSPTGATTALNAGCPVVVILTTHKKEEFAHLPNVVKFINDYTEITVDEALRFIRQSAQAGENI